LSSKGYFHLRDAASDRPAQWRTTSQFKLSSL
jgi:hypothetical protein